MRIGQFIPPQIKSWLRAHPLILNALDKVIYHRKIPVYLDRNIEVLLRSPEEGIYLFQLAMAAKSGTAIVEIGCYSGGSTYFLARGAKLSGAHVYSIDPFNTSLERQMADGDDSSYLENLDKKPSKAVVEESIRRYGLSQVVTLIEGFSREIALNWTGGPISLLFIDGNHQQAAEDFYSWKPYLAPNAVIAFHDTNYPMDILPDVAKDLEAVVRQENARVVCRVDSITAITL